MSNYADKANFEAGSMLGFWFGVALTIFIFWFFDICL